MARYICKTVKEASPTLSVIEAAQRLGISPGKLRTAMKQKTIDIGFATQGIDGRFTFTIYETLVNKYATKINKEEVKT